MEMQVFGAQLSRGTFVNKETGESFDYNKVKLHVLSNTPNARKNYKGKEVGIMEADGDLWEKKLCGWSFLQFTNLIWVNVSGMANLRHM